MQTQWIRMLAACYAAGALVLAAGCGDGSTEPDPGPEYGHIEGEVLDEGSSGVAGATVTLNGSQAVMTDAAGGFRYDSLVVGTYGLALEVPEGYELAAGEMAQKTVQVVADQTATVSWALATVDPELVVIHLTSNLTFSPSSVTIDAGQTVRWVNDAAITHTVTPRDAAQSGVWGDVTLSSAGETFEHTFSVAGETYDYFCRPHEAQGMTGQITVRQ